MTDDPNLICNGPIHNVTGVCCWCGHKHNPVAQVEGLGGHLQPAYDVHCREVWERPRKEVVATFRTINVHEVSLSCWSCGMRFTANSIQGGEFCYRINAGQTVPTACDKCGVGLDVRKASITSLDEGRHLLNRKQRRAEAKRNGR